jgi:hypothetical protein
MLRNLFGSSRLLRTNPSLDCAYYVPGNNDEQDDNCGTSLQISNPRTTGQDGCYPNLIFNTEIVFYRLRKIMMDFRIAGRRVAKVSGEWLKFRRECFLNGIGHLIAKKGGTS